MGMCYTAELRNVESVTGVFGSGDGRMERIDENDVDCFLQQMEQVFAVRQDREKQAEEWRHFPDFDIWIPEVFHPADSEAAAEIFWSEQTPDLLLAQGNAAGMTLQEAAGGQAPDSMEDIRRMLERIDDRTVCYGSGEEADGRVRWLEYKSFAADSRIYNVLFTFGAGEKEMLGTFYCPFEEYGQWKPVIWEIMRTIKERRNERI